MLAKTGIDPFLRESIDRAEELLERVRAVQEGEKQSHFAADCRRRLDSLYGDHSKALQVWDGLLSRTDVYKPPIRRQIIWTILRRGGSEWGQLKSKELERCLRLLSDNFEEVPNDPTSLRLWLRAIRNSANPPSLDSIIEHIVYWKTNTNSLDAAYYLYIMHTLLALDDSVLSRDDAARCIEDCQALASRRRNRTRSFEWLGKGKGIAQLVHHSQLGDKADGGFWQNRKLLVRIEGRIASIEAPAEGQDRVVQRPDGVSSSLLLVISTQAGTRTAASIASSASATTVHVLRKFVWRDTIPSWCDENPSAE